MTLPLATDRATDPTHRATRPSQRSAASRISWPKQPSARQQQLDALPETQLDPVLAAQCASLVQTLSEISAANARLDEGTFGSCVSCGQPIPLERLEFRPWAATCVTCASR